jgi:hypothetical protein
VAADRGADLRATPKTDVAIVVDEGHALVNNGDLVKKPPCSTKPGGDLDAVHVFLSVNRTTDVADLSLLE